ncbi:MAG: MOSC domain-containing protein [Rhizobiaceae bacterium]|nr:MOSC domain-containing protein [Rhizobiaceae bacterium]
MEGHLGELMKRFSASGRVEWIGVRLERHGAVKSLKTSPIEFTGLKDDRRSTPGKRAVTLIQYEHLPVIAALANVEEVLPELLRRNIVVSGINLLALRTTRFQLGSAVLQGSGLCAPCSRMEAALGEGGYTAMRGHGGITASVVTPGQIAIGDIVEPQEPE